MKSITKTKHRFLNHSLALAALAATCTLGTFQAQASVNPLLPFYGSGGVITATPHYPIVGETAQIAVTVGNTGDQPATNVRVKISYNDWGVTFMGWQEISTVLIPSIPAGGTAVAQAPYVFQNRTHTCLEAVIVSSDQNDNPDDDRGQINLEVINAGETFSYDVPIRNNGDQPLNLLLQGRCKGEAAGTPNHECPRVPDRVVVQPGEEVLVPIVADLRGLPPGQALIFVLDAFNLDAVNPYAPSNHNHVELRIVRTSARQLKADAVAELVALRTQTSSRPMRNRYDELINHITKALQTGLWIDDNRVKRPQGIKVFAQEIVVTEQLLNLLRSALPLSVKTTLNEVALKLSDADRILAQTAIQDAGAGAEAEAIEKFQEGDKKRAKGDYKDAVHKYAEAWQEVTD